MQMWEWLNQKVSNIVFKLYREGYISGVSSDDVKQEILVELFQSEELARAIYKSENIRLLYQICKTKIYELNSKQFFGSKEEYQKYTLILKTCKDYGIEPKPENAYKISAILQNMKIRQRYFGITYICTLLNRDSILKYGSTIRECELKEGWNI